MGRMKRLFTIKRTLVKKIGSNSTNSKSRLDGQPESEQEGPNEESRAAVEQRPPKKAKRVWFGDRTLLTSVWEDGDENAGVKGVHDDDNVVSQVSIDRGTLLTRQTPPAEKTTTARDSNYCSRCIKKSILKPPRLHSSEKPPKLHRSEKQLKPHGSEKQLGSEVTSGPTDYGSFLTKIVVNLKHLNDIVKDPDESEECGNPVNIPNCAEDYCDVALDEGVFITQAAEDGTSDTELDNDTEYTESLRLESSQTDISETISCTSSEDTPSEVTEVTKDSASSDSKIITAEEPETEFIRKHSTRKPHKVKVKNKRKSNISTLSFKRKEKDRSIFGKTLVGKARFTRPKTPQKNIFIHRTPGKYSDVCKENEPDPDDTDLLSVKNSSSALWRQSASVYESPPKSAGADDLNSVTSVTSASTRPSSSKSTTSMRSSRSARSRTNAASGFRAEDVLPQRSFFSCHENALKHAGYRISEVERAVAAAKENKHHSQRDPVTLLQKGDKTDEHHLSQASVASSLGGATANLSLSSTKKTKLRKKPKPVDPFEKDEYENRGVQVDPQKVVDYLRMVQKYPDEYRALSSAPDEKVKSKPATRNLVRLGSAFTRFQTDSKNETIVVKAAYELGTKSTHPICAKYEQNERLKKELTTFSAKDSNQGKVLVRGADKAQQTLVDGNLSELERSRAEVELWIRTISTAQLVKAREVALRAVGEGGTGIRQWWVSHKQCRYIRSATPARVEAPGISITVEGVE